MKKTKLLKSHNLAKIFGILGVGGTIFVGSIAAGISANVDKIESLTRAIRDNKVDEFQRANGDVEIKSGANHSGVLVDGKLYMWGGDNNFYGELGTGNKLPSNKPVLIEMPGKVSQFELNQYQSAAVVNNQLYMWGNNDSGVLGMGNTERLSSPTLVSKLPAGTITELSLGALHTGVVVNGQLYTWGSNRNGQLGLGNIGETQVHIPTLVPNLPAGKLTQLSFGGVHSGAIIDGKLFSWGGNLYSQLGIENVGVDDVYTPTKADNPIIKDKIISEISFGIAFSTFISENKLYAWGANDGQMPGIDEVKNPTLVVFPTNVTTISNLIGQNRRITVIADGELYMWGNNNNGQLGLGSIDNHDTPQKIDFFNGKGAIKNVSMGKDWSIAIVGDKMYSWGKNDMLGLGLWNPTTNALYPTLWDIEYKNILLTKNNDKDNIRDKIVFNVTTADVLSLLEQSKKDFGLQPTDVFTNIKQGTIMQARRNYGKDIVSYSIAAEFNSRKFEIIFQGSKILNSTEDIKIGPIEIDKSDKTFVNSDINRLVSEATGSVDPNQILKKWIVDNAAKFIGGTLNPDDINYPSTARLFGTQNFEVVSAADGILKFNIILDKGYIYNGYDRMSLANQPTTIKHPIELKGFNKIKPSVISANTGVVDKKLTAYDLLYTKFEYNTNPNISISDAGLLELQKFVNIDAFPPFTNYKVINGKLVNNSIQFQVQANRYYDINSVEQTGTFVSNTFTIGGLKDATTKAKPISNYPTSNSAKGILKDLGYTDPSNQQIVLSKLEQYVTIENLPTGATLTLGNVNSTDTSLSFNVLSNPHTLITGEAINTAKVLGTISLTGLPKTLNTQVIETLGATKNILAGELIKTFNWNSTTFTYDVDKVAKYVSLAPIPTGTTILMKDLKQGQTNGDVTFNFEVGQYYDNDATITGTRSFPVKISGLDTVSNSSTNTNFMKSNISGDGFKISQDMITKFKQGDSISYSDPTWNTLFNVDAYPIGTEFRIDTITPHDFNIYSTFDISFTANKEYVKNTIETTNIQTRPVSINNLKFTPTSYRPSNIAYSADATYENFYTYIEYNDATGSFNVTKLQEFIILEGYDLATPGTTVKMIDIVPHARSGDVSFKLETQRFVNANGIGENTPKTFDIKFAWTPVPIVANNDQTIPVSDIALGASIGGVFGLVLIAIGVAMLMKRRNATKLPE